MRPEGLEPSRLAALDPKSNVATNYTTAAIFAAKVSIYFYLRYIALLFSYNLGKYTIGERALSPLLPLEWARERCMSLKSESNPLAKKRRRGYASTTQPPTVLIFICRSVSSTPLYEGRTDARYSLLLTLHYVNRLGISTGCTGVQFDSVLICPEHSSLPSCIFFPSCYINIIVDYENRESTSFVCLIFA